MRLIDERTQDGSRCFGSLPQSASWESVCDHVLLLAGVVMVNFVGDGIAQTWFDFHYRRHRFLIDACDGLFWLYVRDPQCSDLILYQVGCHLERLLGTANNDAQVPHRWIAESTTANVA